nr:hypothetical protein DBT53_12370 [Aerococcus mictus]
MTDLFTPAAPQKPKPVEHFCMLCDKHASHGFKLARPPQREGGEARPGDNAFGRVWYCDVHAHVGRALLAAQRRGVA